MRALLVLLLLMFAVAPVVGCTAHVRGGIHGN